MLRWIVYTIILQQLASQYAVQGYEFEMAYQTKCLLEELSKDVLVLIDYKAFHKDNRDELVTVTVTVRLWEGWQLQQSS
jgi:hypothetical protein